MSAGFRFIFLQMLSIFSLTLFKFSNIFSFMAKLNSNRLANLLNAVYSLSRKNKNKTILYWIFLDENRIFDYKKFINSIPPNRNIGVVYRSKEIKKKYNYIKELLRICRKKSLHF